MGYSTGYFSDFCIFLKLLITKLKLAQTFKEFELFHSP